MPTVANGKIPADLLAPVPWDPDEFVAWDALDSLIALNAAFYARFGHNLVINEGYRPYATQVEYKARTRLPPSDPRYLKSAATPGTSVHGWGLAVDFGKIMGFHSVYYLWLAENAPKHGWFHPPQYGEFTKTPEFWHWERIPTRPSANVPERTTTPDQEEDDMFTDADRAALAEDRKRAIALEVKANRADHEFTIFETVGGRRGINFVKSPFWMLEENEGDVDAFVQTGLKFQGHLVAWKDSRDGKWKGTVLTWGQCRANLGYAPKDPAHPDFVENPGRVFGAQIRWTSL